MADKYKHLTTEDINDAEDINELMHSLDPVAQQIALAHIRGMKQMQDIMDKKTA
jgi:glycosidase